RIQLPRIQLLFRHSTARNQLPRIQLPRIQLPGLNCSSEIPLLFRVNCPDSTATDSTAFQTFNCPESTATVSTATDSAAFQRFHCFSDIQLPGFHCSSEIQLLFRHSTVRNQLPRIQLPGFNCSSEIQLLFGVNCPDSTGVQRFHCFSDIQLP